MVKIIKNEKVKGKHKKEENEQETETVTESVDVSTAQDANISADDDLFDEDLGELE